MVEVTVERDAAGAITGFRASGHAGAGPRGSDIVCAAVSALVQAAALGLQERVGAPVGLEAADGRFACRLGPDVPPETRARAQDILETMCLGLREIAAQEPRRLRLRSVRASAG